MSSFSFLTCVNPLNSALMRLTPVFPKGINLDEIVQLFFYLSESELNWHNRDKETFAFIRLRPAKSPTSVFLAGHDERHKTLPSAYTAYSNVATNGTIVGNSNRSQGTIWQC